MLLKKYRTEEKKLTQKEVAEQIGMSERQYRDIESGKSFPRKKVLNALEDMFEKPQRILLAKSTVDVPNYMKTYLQ